MAESHRTYAIVRYNDDDKIKIVHKDWISSDRKQAQYPDESKYLQHKYIMDGISKKGWAYYSCQIIYERGKLKLCNICNVHNLANVFFIFCCDCG